MALDLDGIKTSFKTILDAWNVTGAAYDLSTNLNTRVQRVMKVNPLKIPIQTSFFPYVTIYCDRKDIEQLTIARNQKNAKRQSEVDFFVIGAVWEQLTPDIDADEADEQIEYLMENVEEVLRRNDTLSNTCYRVMPTSVEYHSIPLDEETHMRVGQMVLSAIVHY